MQLDNKNSIRFTSRNKTIRFADDIVRKVNKEFPRISSTIVDDFESWKSKPDYLFALSDRIAQLRKKRLESFCQIDDFTKRFDSFISLMKKFKLGNCDESTHLMSIVAKLNGIRNCYPVLLKSPCGFDLDHVVLYVDGKKPYIMDAWVGFADFVPEAKLRYQKEYRKHFKFDESESEKIVFQKQRNVYSNFVSLDFSNKQMKKFQKRYPDLIIKK